MFLLALATLPLSGCLARTHKVKTRVSTAELKSATLAQLVQTIDSQAAKVKTLKATVDIATSVGGAKKGNVTEYQEIRGYILVRKPGMLRMQGLFPVVRNLAFDMVSNGEQFSLWVPLKNKFFVGSKDVPNPSKNALENLRPQVIMDAILVREIDPKSEIAVLEEGTETVKDPKSKHDVEQPDYVLDVIRRENDGSWFLGRKIFFSRTDLGVNKQIIYDRLGGVATVARYENFSQYGDVTLPSITIIERPQEEYSIQLSVVKMQLNITLRDDQFELPQPANATVVHLDQQRGGSPAPTAHRR